MSKFVVWVCRKCFQSVKVPEATNPDDANPDCPKGGLKIHDWHPVQVDKGF